jgi:uncharacterized SAM-binding protein YcdF (DUF218 family)
MFFIFSKVLYFLLVPFNWIIMLFIWRWLAKSPVVKKRLAISMIVIGILFSNTYLHDQIVWRWQITKPQIEPGKQYEAGILLGGMADFDKQQQGFFGSTADRFIEILKLYNQGVIRKIVVSGGNGNLVDAKSAEADFLEKEFLANNVPPDDLIIENKSRNTFENAVFTKRILDSLHIHGPFVLVSSAIHLRRSEKVFTKAGMPVVCYPAAYDVIDKKYYLTDYLVPNISLLDYWKYPIKEMVGLVVYNLTGKS